MKVILKTIYNILKYIGKFFIFVRNFFLNLLLLAVLGAIIFAFMPMKIAQIPPGTVLRLDISGDIVEEKKLISFLEKVLDDPFNLSVPEPETDLQDILDSINEGAMDDRITTILLNLKDMGKAGLNQLQNIGQALERFKETGKNRGRSRRFLYPVTVFSGISCQYNHVKPYGRCRYSRFRCVPPLL